MKGKLNFIIDALMFLMMAAVAGIGFLMKYILIPGKDRIAKFGRQVDLYFLNWDRHEWGSVHLILGLCMLGLLILHIVLHWQIIRSLFRCLINSKAWRMPTMILFFLVCLFLFIFPFFVHIEIQDLKAGSSGRFHAAGHQHMDESGEATARDFQSAPRTDSVSSRFNSPIHVQGRMTLTEISEYYHIPVSALQSGLNIDDSISSDSQMGHLRKRYGFRMSDVEHLIRQYRQTHTE